jgi:hypothetical protein
MNGIFGPYDPYSQDSTDFLIDCDGITFVDGVIANDFGFSTYNSATLTGNVVGGAEFNHDMLTPVVVVFTSDGKLIKDNGAGVFGTTLASGLNASDNVVFVEGGKEGAALNRKLFIFTGNNPVKVLSGGGVTVTNLATPPADWSANYPASGFVFEGRLCGFGNANDPHRLYFSTTTDHENFTGTGSFSISIFPGEGERLSAAIPVQNGVLLFKYPRGIYFLDATDPVTTNWRVYKVSSKLGTPSQKCVADIGKGILFIDSSGFPYFASRDMSGSFVFSNIAEANSIKSLIKKELNGSIIKSKWFAFYDPLFDEFGFSDTFKVISIDLQEGSPRFRKRKVGVLCAFNVYGVNSNTATLCFGDKTGNILKKEQGRRLTSFNFTTSSYDFIREKQTSKRSIMGEVEFSASYVGNTTGYIDLSIFVDGTKAGSKRINLSPTFGVAKYGTILNPGTGAYYNQGYRYSAGQTPVVVIDKFRVLGSGRFVSLKASGSFNSDKCVARINKVILRASIGDERV